MKKDNKYRLISYLIIIGIFVLFTMQSIGQFSSQMKIDINDVYALSPYMIPSAIIPALIAILTLYLIQSYKKKQYSNLLKKSIGYFYGGLFRIVSYTIVLNMLMLWSIHISFNFGIDFNMSFSNEQFTFFILNRLAFSFVVSLIIMIYLKIISSIGDRYEL